MSRDHFVRLNSTLSENNAYQIGMLGITPDSDMCRTWSSEDLFLISVSWPSSVSTAICIVFLSLSCCLPILHYPTARRAKIWCKVPNSIEDSTYKGSLAGIPLTRGVGSGFNVQYKNWRFGPAVAAITVAAPTRPPTGTVSVPLPRTPSENIRSKTRGSNHYRTKIRRIDSSRTSSNEGFSSSLTVWMEKCERRADSL